EHAPLGRWGGAAGAGPVPPAQCRRVERRPALAVAADDDWPGELCGRSRGWATLLTRRTARPPRPGEEARPGRQSRRRVDLLRRTAAGRHPFPPVARATAHRPGGEPSPECPQLPASRDPGAVLRRGTVDMKIPNPKSQIRNPKFEGRTDCLLFGFGIWDLRFELWDT